MAAAATDDDGWVNLAMNDEAAVVDVLLLLRHAEPPRPSKTSRDLPSLRWSVRQRRSKNVPRHHHAATSSSLRVRIRRRASRAKPEPAPPRRSPGAAPLRLAAAPSTAPKSPAGPQADRCREI
ncbi:hypothetical protein Prudu_008769 [Prunus dulcis]|uniref:Uncharacterized protein n=1 Tax=Prunus dulcis TaxID=3755 RepID=A0A4Y1R4X6_PRUDU|nr:hypothetical protein Prudu_008769 [Prunus dulcis]